MNECSDLRNTMNVGWPLTSSVVGSITALLEARRQEAKALNETAQRHANDGSTSAFHSHFRSSLLKNLSFKNSLFIKDSKGIDQLHPHFWSQCQYTDPPVWCLSEDDDCSVVNSHYRCTLIDDNLLSKIYGSRYLSSPITSRIKTFMFNGVSLVKGRSYCLPSDLIPSSTQSGDQYACDHLAGELEVVFNNITGQFDTKCSCKWPDFFGGPTCSDYQGCKIDGTLFGELPTSRIKLRHASLINRDTNDTISNIDDLHNLWNKYDDEINLYDVSKQLKHSGGPAWYCACKELDTNTTGGIVAGTCIADPCLPLTNFMRLTEDESYGYSVAVGTLDSRDTKSPNWACHCGNPKVTRLFGGGDVPCSPLVNPGTFQNWEVERFNTKTGILQTIKNVTCAQETDIFIPCLNKFRPSFNGHGTRGLPKCSEMGFPGIVNPDMLPEAGACVDVCKYCNFAFQIFGGNEPLSDICSTDDRTIGVCQVDLSQNNENPLDNRYNFKCQCGPDGRAKWWNVTTPLRGPCEGNKPPCIKHWDPCNQNLNMSDQGPQCCLDAPLCGSTITGHYCVL